MNRSPRGMLPTRWTIRRGRVFSRPLATRSEAFPGRQCALQRPRTTPGGRQPSSSRAVEPSVGNSSRASTATEEARRNLTAKFPAVLADYEALLSDIRIVGHPPDLPFPAGLAAKDQPIFRAALATGASHLLTGDIRDFGHFMNRPEETFGIRIQTVAGFLALRRG